MFYPPAFRPHRAHRMPSQIRAKQKNFAPLKSKHASADFTCCEAGIVLLIGRPSLNEAVT